MRAALLLVLALALAACQTTPPATSGPSSDEAHALYASLTELVKSCWFGSGDTTFAGYNYSPEVNAGVPRILLVTKTDPGGRPVVPVPARFVAARSFAIFSASAFCCST